LTVVFSPIGGHGGIPLKWRWVQRGLHTYET
jgi:hypothetical protein